MERSTLGSRVALVPLEVTEPLGEAGSQVYKK
jgi:hypothetical protein